MIKWCAYCQQFLGEVPPYEDFSLTHGLCDRCSKKGALEDEALLERLAPIKGFYRDLVELASTWDPHSAEDYFERGIKIGLRPLDILFGVLQPALYEIGDRWCRNQITVADEHRFTAFCSGVVSFARAQLHTLLKQPSLEHSPQVLLANVEGNYHCVGLQIIEIYLLTLGIPAVAYYPGLPIQEIVTLIGALNPKWVGLSVSMPEQYGPVAELANALDARKGSSDMKILLGGAALRRVTPVFSSERVVICPDLELLRSFIQKAGA